MFVTYTMFGIGADGKLETIGLSTNPNLYSTRREAEEQARRNEFEVIEVELVIHA